MNERQRELKRERDKRYREKKKAQPKATELPAKERWNPDRERREVIDILRTGIRLKHRHQANREAAALEARVIRRLNDCSHNGPLRFVLDNLQDIEEFASLSRRELYGLAGWDYTDDFVEYA